MKIGPHLNEILHHPLTVRMRSIDVGTVSAYFEIENTNGVQR